MLCPEVVFRQDHRWLLLAQGICDVLEPVRLLGMHVSMMCCGHMPARAYLLMYVHVLCSCRQLWQQHSLFVPWEHRHQSSMMDPTPLLLQQTVVRSSSTTPTRPQATTSLPQLDTCIATTPPLRVCRVLLSDFNFFSSIVLFDVLTIVLVTDALFVLHCSNCVHSWCLCAYHQPELVQEV